MPHTHNREKTDLNDAVKILAGLKKRVERLESENIGGSQRVQLSRQAVDEVGCTDQVSVEERSAGGFIWNQSKWSFDEFAQTN